MIQYILYVLNHITYNYIDIVRSFVLSQIANNFNARVLIYLAASIVPRTLLYVRYNLSGLIAYLLTLQTIHYFISCYAIATGRYALILYYCFIPKY